MERQFIFISFNHKGSQSHVSAYKIAASQIRSKKHRHRRVVADFAGAAEALERLGQMQKEIGHFASAANTARRKKRKPQPSSTHFFSEVKISMRQVGLVKIKKVFHQGLNWLFLETFN